MFENILYQSAASLLKDDLKHNTLPGSLLFSGPASSGKLSCGLELARVLGCHNYGDWNCNCPSCKKNRVLVNQNVIITGPCDRVTEIKAASETFLNAAYNNTNHLKAARILFIRSVRKLTSRFNPILWEGDDKLSKFSPILAGIEENLELINPSRTTLPENEELNTIVDDVYSFCLKLEESFLYDNLPVSQIRNFSSWARLSSSNGKKILIIENADRMADATRNALLKILEEPPVDTEFILTTTNRLAMIPTILSRLRNYSFFERSPKEQQVIIDKVFHYIPKSLKPVSETIEKFLQNYLPVEREIISYYAKLFLKNICQGNSVDAKVISTACANFTPRLIYKAFLEEVINLQSKLVTSPKGCEASAKIIKAVQASFNNVNVYNQNPVNSLEELSRSLKEINYYDSNVLNLIGFENE